MKNFKNQKGFTLIELLVVIGILAVLLAITLIAINPARQFAQANNTQRSSDVNTILNAVNQFMADNKGVLPPALAAATCTQAAQCTLTNDPVLVAAGTGVNICPVLVSGYLAALPVDPTEGVSTDGDGTPVTEVGCTINAVAVPPVTLYNTGYKIYQSANNRVTVSATAEPIGAITPVISVTR